MTGGKTTPDRHQTAISAKTRVGRPRRTNPTLVSFIADQLAVLSPKEVQAAIAADPRLSAMGIPALRTIERIAQQRRPASARWIALEADPDEVALVLPVVGELLDTLTRQVLALTTEEARAIAWLRTVAPDLPAREAFDFGRAIARTGPGDQDTRLAPYLALTPWRDGARRYLRAQRRGRLPAFVLSGSTEGPYHEEAAARQSRRAAGDAADWEPDGLTGLPRSS